MDLFLIVWVVAMVYIIVGTYLYYFKVLPMLQEKPSYWTPTILRQIQAYVMLCDRKEKRPWFLPFLRYQKRLLMLMVSVIIMAILYDSVFGQ